MFQFSPQNLFLGYLTWLSRDPFQWELKDHHQIWYDHRCTRGNVAEGCIFLQLYVTLKQEALRLKISSPLYSVWIMFSQMIYHYTTLKTVFHKEINISGHRELKLWGGYWLTGSTPRFQEIVTRCANFEMYYGFWYIAIWLRKTFEYRKTETFCSEDSKRLEQVSCTINTTLH